MCSEQSNDESVAIREHRKTYRAHSRVPDDGGVLDHGDRSECDRAADLRDRAIRGRAGSDEISLGDCHTGVRVVDVLVTTGGAATSDAQADRTGRQMELPRKQVQLDGQLRRRGALIVLSQKHLSLENGGGTDQRHQSAGASLRGGQAQRFAR